MYFSEINFVFLTVHHELTIY